MTGLVIDDLPSWAAPLGAQVPRNVATSRVYRLASASALPTRSARRWAEKTLARVRWCRCRRGAMYKRHRYAPARNAREFAERLGAEFAEGIREGLADVL